MSKILMADLAQAAYDAGLTLMSCGGCHYQLIGGSKLVNFYDTIKGSKIYVDGERKGRFVNSVARVIEATGAKQQPKDSSPTTVRPLDDKLEGIRYCIVNGHEEDAHEHILDLLRGLRVKSKTDAELTPSGLKLKALWKSDR